MFGHVLASLVLLLGVGQQEAESAPRPVVATEVAAGDNFHRAVIETAVKQVRAGKMRRAELIKLRVAMLSPAFRNAAEDLAVTQMAASGSEGIPLTEDGLIDRASIDWDAVLAFIEKLIPLILKLMEIFGGTASVSVHLDSLGAPMMADISIGGCTFAVAA